MSDLKDVSPSKVVAYRFHVMEGKVSREASLLEKKQIDINYLSGQFVTAEDYVSAINERDQLKKELASYKAAMPGGVADAIKLFGSAHAGYGSVSALVENGNVLASALKSQARQIAELREAAEMGRRFIENRIECDGEDCDCKDHGHAKSALEEMDTALKALEAKHGSHE